MPEKYDPAFRDCAYPEDCECAKRGYELEHDRCAVPGVRVVAARLGISIPLSEKERPKPAIFSSGDSVMLLGDSGNMARDVIRALQAMPMHTTDLPNEDEIARMIRYEQASRGLQAEAGVGGGAFFLILHTETETLASGAMLYCNLALMQTPRGDGTAWQISLRQQNGQHVGAVLTCSLAMRDTILAMLRAAAGGPSTNEHAYKGHAPSEDDVRKLEEE